MWGFLVDLYRSGYRFGMEQLVLPFLKTKSRLQEWGTLVC